MTLTPEFEQTTATVTCWRIPLTGFPAVSTCEATTVDADRAVALLNTGPVTGREWEKHGNEAGKDSDDT